MIAVEYLRVLVVGVCARVWRGLTGGPCPCEICQAHRAHAHRGAAADGAHLSTLDELRRGRHR